MAQIITGSQWTQQPQVPVEIDWSNPLTRGLQLVVCPSFDLKNAAKNSIMSVGSALVKTATNRGISYLWDRSAANPVDTKYSNASINSHSCFVLTRHRSLSGASNETYISNRVSGNNGFSFYTYNALDSYPTQTFKLGYVHGGVAAYESSNAVSGANTLIVPVGFSASASGSVRFFAKGAFLQSIATGVMNSSSDSLRVGRDVFFSSSPAHFESPLLAYWSRALSDQEHLELSRNPWQIFRPITRRIYVDIPAASGDTTLIVGDGYHDHFADNVTLTGVGGNTDLTVANCLHAHAADNIALASQYFLAAQDAAHSHTADNVTLSLAGAESLTVQDASHAHTADNVTLSVTTAIDLAVNDAAHTHVADAVTLSVQSVLGISDVSHAHFADSVALSSVTSLIVADAFHTLTSTSPFFSSFTESQLAEILAYVELNMAVPTVDEIAAAIVAQLPAAVLAAAQVTPIHSDMRKTVGTTLKGDGTEADKFRSVLVD